MKTHRMTYYRSFGLIYFKSFQSIFLKTNMLRKVATVNFQLPGVSESLIEDPQNGLMLKVLDLMAPEL